jgi:hypothetical protein
MFEDLANPLKGKGREKDVGKRRAYVRVVTNLGGGSLNLELFCEKVLEVMLRRSLPLKTHVFSSGSKNVLQLSYASEGWQVRQLPVPSASTWIYGWSYSGHIRISSHKLFCEFVSGSDR